MTQVYIITQWYKIKYPELESEFIFQHCPNEKVMLKHSDILIRHEDGTFVCENRLLNFPLKVSMEDVIEMNNPIELRCCEY